MNSLFRYLMLLSFTLMLGACDVHQWPIEKDIVVPDTEIIVKLGFDRDMKVWEHYYDVETKVLTPLAAELPVYDNRMTDGVIRHVIRVYPYDEYNSNLDRHVCEFSYFEDLSESDYDFETKITLPLGDYTIVAWSDLVPPDEESYIHDVTEFASAQIVDHRINSDYRDAFRGTRSLMAADILPGDPVVVELEMHRPMAKFEIIADGLEEFLEREASRRVSRQGIEDYKVAIAYAGYMPFAYNILTDGIVDSRYREVFISSPTIIDSSSASLGFDYALIRNSDSTAPVQIGIYDADGEELALSDPIQIPLRRDHHTVIRGNFFSAHSSGGSIGIDPDFDGEFNIFH